MKNKIFIFVLLAGMLGLLAGCAPGSVIQINTPVPNPQANKADAHDRVAGILLGLWHGFISPVTLVLSFINPNVQMYEVHNDGSVYNLGFFLGVAIVFVVLGALIGSSRR
jgi:hypothetical protein